MADTLSPTDLTVAEALLARGNTADAVATLLDVSETLLTPLVEKAEAVQDLEQGYRKGDASQTFGEWCAAWLADNPNNVLDLNVEKPWLSVAGIARKEQWHPKGEFLEAQAARTGTGRPRVDNSEEKLRAAANLAIQHAERDTRLNLKLAQIKAAADVGVTDLNGMTKVLQELKPNLWAPRKISG